MNANPFISKFSFTRLAAALIGLLLWLLLAPTQSAWAQAADKKIGFAIQVSTDGYFSTTVAKVEVTQVSPGSQALAAGVAAGDEVVKIQDITVPGNSAGKLKEHMDFVPGVPKKLTF
jgi:ABC-type sugar transport system substrate-binding protein